jgi:hypothetical protein
MRFVLKEEPVIKPIVITLVLDEYYGAKLPTLYANDVPLLHILDDGRICVRSRESTNILKLAEMGFPLFNGNLNVIMTSALLKG